MQDKTIIGSSAYVTFPELELARIPARIDTGARTSTIWASKIEEKDGSLTFTLFDKPSQHFNGMRMIVKEYSLRPVTSSNGITEERFMVRLLVEIEGRKIRAMFTLANRSTQTYPILVGRNVLRGKFVVDIKHSKPILTVKRTKAEGQS